MRLFWKAFAVGGAGLVLAGPMTALLTSDAATALRLERLFGGVCGPGSGGGPPAAAGSVFGLRNSTFWASTSSPA